MHFLNNAFCLIRMLYCYNGKKGEKFEERWFGGKAREKERCGSNATINEWPISRNLLTNPDSLSQHLMR